MNNPRRSSLGTPHRLVLTEALAPLSPRPVLPSPERPLPQLFTRGKTQPLQYPCALAPSLPNASLSRSVTTTQSKLPTKDQISQHPSQLRTHSHPRQSTAIERSKSTQGLPGLHSNPRVTSFPPTSNHPLTCNNTTNNHNNSSSCCSSSSSSRSMATSIYQLVSTRVKGQVPSTPRESFTGNLLRHVPSFTGSETTSRTNYSRQSNNSSVPSLANSVSSQSTVLSSLSSNQSALNQPFAPINPTPPSVAPKLSFRSTSGTSINKSIHSLLRRRKQKPVDLSLNPSPNPSTILSHHSNNTPITATQLLPKPVSALQDLQACKSALPFCSFPKPRTNPTNESNACGTSTPTADIGHELPEYPQTTIFSGSLIIAKDLPLAGTHPRPSGAKPAPRRTESGGSSGEDSEMEDMITNLRAMAQTHKPAAPHGDHPPGPDRQEVVEEEEEEEEDFGMDEMMKNLRDLAATRKHDPAGPASVRAETRSVSEDDDDCSVDYSDSESESSFEADVLHDDDDDALPHHFPLPSWPKLDSTSQSPFSQQSLRASTYRPAECSVSISIDHIP